MSTRDLIMSHTGILSKRWKSMYHQRWNRTRDVSTDIYLTETRGIINGSGNRNLLTLEIKTFIFTHRKDVISRRCSRTVEGVRVCVCHPTEARGPCVVLETSQLENIFRFLWTRNGYKQQVMSNVVINDIHCTFSRANIFQIICVKSFEDPSNLKHVEWHFCFVIL